MDRPTKVVANYRYPPRCCGRCRFSYQNTMGDNQCTMLTAGNTIDFGAVCDLFVMDGATCTTDAANERAVEGLL